MYPKKPNRILLTSMRRRICKPLVRNSHFSVVRECLKDSTIFKHLLKGIGCKIHKEIAKLCSDDIRSVLCD